MSAVCRWGILGTANIARKNWKAIRLAENATLAAVGSRDVAKAKTFIDECSIEVPFAAKPQACTYDELLGRKDVDAVYIPLPTGIRREWVVKAAEAGKHVLCEKPCAPTAADLQVMLDACRKNRVQFMDGVMFMHGKRLPLLRQAIDDGETIGELRRIASQFTFRASDEFFKTNIRATSELEPLGCLGDLGWYNLRFSLFVMKYAMPERVVGHLLADHNKVPTEFSADLFYPAGVTASFYCSFRTELQQWAHISGTRGSIQVADFVLPYFGCESAFIADTPKFNVKNCSYHWESHPRRHAVSEYSDGHPDAQETNMIRNFSTIVGSGKLDETWGEIALKTQRVMDACVKSASNGGRAVGVE
ncbi:MAG TPA: Gfo/Idh/MocA family oxidoreductase [Gemmataceae bacterium]|nr:Gfo/Idh/MocA family oxidoreductase [Gemmataceae bacterium]